MAKPVIEEFAVDPEAMRLFQQERLIVAVTELVCKAMQQKRMKRFELARLLGKTPGRISQYLDGERNLTLRTVADIFNAIGMTLSVNAEPRDAQTETNDVVLPRDFAPRWSPGRTWSGTYKDPFSSSAMVGQPASLAQ